MLNNPSPRERRHQKTKATILQAARELISERGLEGLSLRELARRTDYSPSGLYEYFESKEAIINEISTEGFARLAEYLKRAPVSLSPSARLVEMGLAYLDFARDHPEHFMLIFTNFTFKGTSSDDPIESDSPYHILLQAVQVAIDAEEFKPQEGYSLEEIAYSLWSLVHGMAMLRQTYLRHFQADFDTIHRRALELFATGLNIKQLSAL